MTSRGQRVLLVDDDPEVAWLVGRYLTRAELQVTPCGNGAEAIALLEREAFDTVVTDIQMPKLNGLALIDWIRQHRPGLRVIVITAFGSPTVRDVSLRRGAIMYLEKPIDPAVLVELLRTTSATNAFLGSVSEIDLFDYLQLMLVTRRAARLEVTSSQGERCELFLDNGDVVHAQGCDREGEAAIFHCLTFTGGYFATLPWAPPAQRTIERRGEFLLLEAARMKDEGGREPGPPGQRQGEKDVDDLLDVTWEENVP